MNVSSNILIFIILGYIIGSLFYNVSLVELDNIQQIYAQSNTDSAINNNNISSVEDIQCFDNPCTAQLDETADVADNENSTALIGISFKDVQLQDIQENKEILKASLASYINSTIDAFATGNMVTETRCFPLDIFDQPSNNCPIIDGIVINPPDEIEVPGDIP